MAARVSKVMGWLILGALFGWLLAGCAAPLPPRPPYMVLLTSRYPSTLGRCGGVAVDATRVVTVAHCTPGRARVVALDGQEAFAIHVARRPDHDLALVTVAPPLRLSAYAEFGSPFLFVPAALYGACTHYVTDAPRQLYYAASVSISVEGGPIWHYEDWWLLPASAANRTCPGDSGGPIVQAGRVVALVAGYDDREGKKLGRRVFAVPAATIEQLLAP
jgi:S1-C subfamily serine protease